MKRILICTFAFMLSQMLAACATTSTGSRELAAASKGGGSRPESAPTSRTQGPPRSQGTVMSSHPSKNPVQTNPNKDDSHKVVVHNNGTGNDETHKVIVDQRPAHVVSHDPHVRVMRRGGNFHPVHNWDHFHPVIITGYSSAWWGVWGVNGWDTVGTVTCEAVNEATNEMYPATMERDSQGWDDPAINNVLDEALEDCMAEATVADGATSPCIAATPACSFETWDGRVYSPN